MNHFLARVILASTSGIPADSVVNDWSFQCEVTPDLPSLASTVAGTYFETPSGTGVSLSEVYLASTIPKSGVVHRVDIYQRSTTEGAPLGSPIYSYTFSLLPPSGSPPTDLPAEVACCWSIHAEFGSFREHEGTDRPRASRRGRLYIGPLNINAIAEPGGAGHNVEINSNLRTLLATMGTDRISRFPTDTGATWEVWSNKLWDGNPVIGGWIDNAPDTQRRRGFKSTTRTTF